MVFWIMELSKLNPNPNRYPKISKNQIPKKIFIPNPNLITNKYPKY